MADTISTFATGNVQDNEIVKAADFQFAFESLVDNFFKFTLHKGEKSVDEIIVMGDNPLLENISSFLRENIQTTITVIDDVAIDNVYPQFKAKHASLIGLALKEVNA